MCSQLERIEEGLDQINSDMKEAEKNLTDLGKCCGLCALDPQQAAAASWRTTTIGDAAFVGQPFEQKSGVPVSRQSSANQRPAFGLTPPRRRLCDRVTQDAREDEMNDNLAHVGSIVGNLRCMALDMGNEIDSQNVQMERVRGKAILNVTRIDTANQKANNLMKR
uniref:Zgc:101731 n=1 Tax=Hippocampus comes TaxID=109280 RepID=A0A3Q3D5Z3_HIPCM